VRAIALLEEMAGLRERPGINVNVGVSNQTAVAIRPGYVVRLPNYDKPSSASPEREALPAGDAERG
jgi:hypothetical protein